MNLTPEEAQARLVAHDHGVLGTVHPKRGVDAVPVVYSVDDDGFVGVPIDQVKPKASSRLQRERNLEADHRATLLVDHWDSSNWSRLWWVRAGLIWHPDAPPDHHEAMAALLAKKYSQYEDQPFARVLVLRITDVIGWAGSAN